MALVFCSFLASCSEDYEKDAAIEITEDFVIEYYVSNDVQGALHNTAKRARKKLEAEWSDIKKYKSDISVSDKSEPPVTYTLLGAEKLKDYIYVVHWQIIDGLTRDFKVDIKAVDSNEGWKIINFQEDEE